MRKETNIKAIIYCRVSSKEQEETGYSLDAQEKLLVDYATSKGFTVEKIYRISESASSNKQRKIFSEMMGFLRKRGNNTLLCEKTDRLTRTRKDAVVIDDWVKENDERRVHFVKENFILDKNSRANEKFIWGIKVEVAQYYTNNLSEEVKKGQKEKIAQGHLPTTPPLGYITKGEKGKKIHVPDMLTSPLIRKMFDLYSTGNYSLFRLELEMYNAGLRTRSGKRLLANSIHLLLSNPFYYGKLRWNDVTYDAIHEPIVSKELFSLVQLKLKRTYKSPYRRKHNPIFKAKLSCENCGGMVTWEIQKGHWYGHCHNHKLSRHCTQKTYIRQEKVEEQVLAYLPQIAPKSQEMLAWIEETIKTDFEEDTKAREIEVSRLNTLLAKVRQKKDKYYEARVDQTVPEDFCNRKIKECLEEEESLKTALDNADQQSELYKELRIAIHRLAFYASKIYQKTIVDEKRLLLSQFFTNLLQNGYEIKPKYTLAAEYLATWMPKLNHDYELKNTLVLQGQKFDFGPELFPKLAWKDTLRMPDWQQMFPFPNSSLEVINKLLAVVE
jgi:DNA invertase Pin-like site-specific DNA recombinase